MREDARSALEGTTPNVEVGILRVDGYVQRPEACSWQQDMRHKRLSVVTAGRGT